MIEFTTIELEAAKTAILSTIRKNEKVIDTLSKKQPPRTSQIVLISKNLKVLNISFFLITKALDNEIARKYSIDELEEACEKIQLFIHKVEEVKPKFKEGTPQHTLAIRRIKAFQIAASLIIKELDV